MIPYALDKNLGRAYNEAMEMIPEDEWACLMDYDAQFLTPTAIKTLYKYIEVNPDAFFTCITNRVHPCNKEQLYQGVVSNNADMRNHIAIAESLEASIDTTSPLVYHMSGFMMLISKKMWTEIKFTEDLKCLGVDTDYFSKLKVAGKEILRIDGIYVFHNYRLMRGINNKKHLL